MDKILEQLFAGNVLNEDTKKAIKAAFESVVSETKKATQKAVRAELAEEFNKNKSALYRAVEQYVESRMEPVIKELHGSVKEAETLKTGYAKRITEAQATMKKEFESRWAKLVEAADAVANRELSELHEGELVNRRAYLAKMNELTAKFAKMEAEFKKKAALVLENLIDDRVQAHLDEHANDLRQAKKMDFGLEIFEAYHNVFGRHFFNTNKEFRALTEKVTKLEDENKKIVESATAKVKEAHETAKKAQVAHKRLAESVARTDKINTLIGGLKGAARDHMRNLLEACTTPESMDRTFKKAIQDIMNESRPAPKPAPKPVVEMKTGGMTRSVNENVVDNDEDEDIIDLRRRIGAANR